MRTIQLTHEEIEIIKTALEFVYDKNVEIVQQNKRIIGEDVSSAIFEKAKIYFNTIDVFDGSRDI